MYYSDQDTPLSDVDSTVTPIEYMAVGERQFGCLLESDELSSLDLKVDKLQKKKRLVNKPARSSSSSEQSDQPENDSALSANDLQKIYKEFQEINKKLREENLRLHDREEAVKERERIVVISQDSLHTITDFQVKQQLREREEHHQAEVFQLEQQLSEKTRQNKRLKENFETLKYANDTLRKELETSQVQHEKLERQSNSLQGRLTNLQRKQELSQRQPLVGYPGSAQLVPTVEDKLTKLHKQKDTHTTRTTKPRVGVGVYDILGVLLDWVCDLHLRQAFADQPARSPESVLSTEATLKRCLKVLPNLAEVMRDFPSSHNCIYLPCLQFIYWSLVNLEHSQHPQKSSLSSTLRRLGEELYKPRVVRFLDSERVSSPVSPTRTQDKGDKSREMYEKGDKSREQLFFRSTDLHSRFLSSLIILKTLTQADVLAHVFDCLRNDLKTNTGKDLFLYYQATPIILPFLRPVQKTFLSAAVDIYLQMSMESAFLPEFIKSCSNENWFRTMARVVRSPTLPTEILEKISIILQKLSKIKSNKKYFAVYTLTTMIQELVRGVANDSAFLSMNLKSILFNLGVQQVKVSNLEH